MRSKFYIYTLTVISLIFFSKCKKEKMEEAVETAEEVTQIENDIYRTYDVVEDYLLGFFNGGSGILKGQGAEIVLKNPVIIVGQGIKGYFDFNSSDSTGIEGKDNIFRLGRIHFSVDRPYNKDSSVLSISIHDSVGFHIGNEDKVYKLSGEMTVYTSFKSGKLTRFINIPIMTLNYGKGDVNYSGDWEIRGISVQDTGLWRSDTEIITTSFGTNHMGQEFKITTSEALKRTYRENCTRIFVKGKQDLETGTSSFKSQIIYNPFIQESCDWLVKVESNRKEYFHYLR